MPYQRRKQQTRNWLSCLFAMSLLVGAGLACGQGKVIPYPDTFRSTGQCRAEGAGGELMGEAVLVTTVRSGPNSTICILRASDGILLKHYDLAIHGDVAGQSNGLLYLNERGGDDGHVIGLCAIRLLNGQQRWCQPQVNVNYFSSFQSDNGMVFVKTNSGNGSNVLALSEADGRLLWSYSAAPANSGADFLTPVLDHGIIYVSTFQNLHTGVYDPSTTISHICALQESLGKQLWCSKLGEPGIDGIAAGDGLLYARVATYGTDSSAAVYALDLATGATRWHIPLGSSQTVAYHPQLLVSGGTVYVNVRNCRCYASTDLTDLLYALNATNGKQFWMTTMPDAIQALTATRSTLYVGAEGGDGITALRTSNGTRLWNHSTAWGELASPAFNTVQRFVISNQTLYTLVFFDNFSSILSLNMQNGNAIWQDSACNAPPGIPIPETPPISNVPGPPGRCYWEPDRSSPTFMAPLTA